jgi:peptide methionine sulfoxide reductase msrA/msrB
MKISNYLLILLIFLCSCNAENNNTKTPKEPTQSSTKNEKKSNKDSNGYNILTAEEKYILLNKGTESAGSGKYNKFYKEGLYICKQCDESLFRSDSKFDSKSGWPSFDSNISGAIMTVADGSRTEIVCKNCKGHLGHVFFGEGFTKKKIRHCVNSLSLDFYPKKDIETAIFASGCFWGTEHWLAKAKGVLSTSCGYIGGKVKDPTYKQICTGTTGHAEAVEVIFDKSVTDYETLCKLFFETHDPSQVNRQGPDIGTQYRSVVFTTTPEQTKITNKLIKILRDSGTKVATKVTEAPIFYDAEAYHQDYYEKNQKQPYCHKYIKRFK